MPRYYQVDSFCFYPQKNQIHHGEEIYKVRPKTSELFTRLLEANGEIVSKEQLLRQVWTDVVVEDYVIFQSITELRKVLKNAPIIKTHPRKGYSVTGKINFCEDDKELVQAENTNVATERVGPFNMKSVAFFTTFLLLVLAGLYISEHHEKDVISRNEGTVIVLPVTNKIQGAEHLWVSYGAMDLLIKYLQPQSKMTVLPTELVLDTLKRAELEVGEVDDEHITRIFEVSGAETIISQSISGFKGDYQLVYSIFKRNGIERGVLFKSDINKLFLELNSLLLNSMGASKNVAEFSYHNSFSNELMASAIDAMQSADYENASTLYKAVLVKEPENLLASLMLSKSLAHLGQFKEGESVAAMAADLAIKMGEIESSGRLLFWQSVSVTQQRNFPEALSLLVRARSQAVKSEDDLYIANIARVTGKIYLQQKKYHHSREEISSALTIYKSLNEPYGQASMYIDLGELELAMNNVERAKDAFKTALQLSKKGRLQQLIDTSNKWLESTAEKL